MDLLIKIFLYNLLILILSCAVIMLSEDEKTVRIFTWIISVSIAGVFLIPAVMNAIYRL